MVGWGLGKTSVWFLGNIYPTAQPKCSWQDLQAPQLTLPLKRPGCGGGSRGTASPLQETFGKSVSEKPRCPLSSSAKHHPPPRFLPETKFTLRKFIISSHSRLQHPRKRESHLLIL